MAVVKVRASAHSDQLREFSIDDGGVRIGDMLPDQEGLLGGRPTRKRSLDLPVRNDAAGATRNTPAGEGREDAPRPVAFARAPSP